MDSDPSVQVKDTAAWTIGRICEHTPAAVLSPPQVGQGGVAVNRGVVLNQLLQALSVGLSREPRVAANVCWVSVIM